jgi:hypothetical protein
VVHRQEGVRGVDLVKQLGERWQARRAQLEVEEVGVADHVGVAVERGDLGAGDEERSGMILLELRDVRELRTRVVIGDCYEVEAGR